MTKSGKILLGILSFLPLVFMAVYIISFFLFFATEFRQSLIYHSTPAEDLALSNILTMVIFILVCGVVSLGLLVYYIIHVINNKAIDSTERLIWILIFLFAGLLGFPIYWYMRVWKTPLPLAGSSMAV